MGCGSGIARHTIAAWSHIDKVAAERKVQANERMQLTWLIGVPIRVGLGSLASRRAARPRFIRHAADASRWAAPPKAR